MKKIGLLRTTYLSQLHNWRDSPLIKIITGMRRVGKSTLLYQWKETLLDSEEVDANRLLFIPCDTLEYTDLQDWTQLKELIGPLNRLEGKKYLLIDEIQHIRGWEKVITALHRGDDWDIYITGSNSEMLSGELATRISGRYVIMQVYPFSYREHLQIKKQDEHSPGEFMNYLESGGIPVLYHVEDDRTMKNQILESIYATIVLKDIIERYRIRNVDLLDRIARYFMDNIGNLSNAKKIADYCKSQRISVGVETVQNYMHYLENCFVLNRVRRYDIKGKKHLEVNEKLFASDTGLRNGVLGKGTEDISGLLENLVYLELKRRGYQVSVGCFGEWEIDFIARKGKEREYFQVSYLLSSEETIEREFRPLESIQDNYPKTVLTLDPVDLSRNGISHCPLPEWLLNV
jgi:uncharacterized protein